MIIYINHEILCYFYSVKEPKALLHRKRYSMNKILGQYLKIASQILITNQLIFGIISQLICYNWLIIIIFELNLANIKFDTSSFFFLIQAVFKALRF